MVNCPHCESDQFKKATLVHAEGQSVTVGVGVGVGSGGLGIGVGRGATTSALAEKCAPPKMKEPNIFGDAKMWQFLVVAIPTLFAFAGGGHFSGMDFFWLTWGAAGSLFLFSKGWDAQKKGIEKHKLDIALYEKTYMCLRCGALSQPFDDQA